MQSLAVKYRPKTFDEIVSQNYIKDILLKQLETNNLKNCYLFAGASGCVDKDTEYFTGTCWKRISDYKEGDRVLVFDPKTRSAFLEIPQKYIKLPCDKFNVFKTKYGIDMQLSDEHTIVYETSKGHINTKQCEEFVKLHNNSKYGFDARFLTTFTYSGVGIDLTDSEIKLMCAVICDGSFRKDSNTSWCCVNLKKDRKINLLRSILQECRYGYKETKQNNGFTRFYFNAPRKEKEFTSYWYNCSNHQLQVICENILNWDGSITNNRKRFTQKNKSTIDFVQFAFTSCGYRSSIKEVIRNQTKIVNGKTYHYPNNHYYTLQITDTNKISLGRTKIIQSSSKDGFKYCFTVSTHMWVMRRNGNIIISGNCGKAQPLTSKILTLSGYKLMKDIRVGDIIIDGSGKSTKVLGVFPQGKRDIYKIYFNDNTYIEVADNHLNSVYTLYKGRKKDNFGYIKTNEVMTTLELLEKVNNNKYKNKHTLKYNVETPIIDCWNDNNLLVNPYLLGCLIGDGGLHKQLRFTNKDTDIICHVNKLLTSWDCELIRIKDTYDYKISPIHSKCKYVFECDGVVFHGVSHLINYLMSKGYPKFDSDTLFRFINNPTSSITTKKYPELIGKIKFYQNPYFQTKTLRSEIHNLGLDKVSNEKKIPLNYLMSSISSRIALLQGLMDTDGTIEKNGRCYLSTSSKELAEDVVFLCRSLGGIAHIVVKNKVKYLYKYKDINELREGKPSYLINMKFKDIVPFICDRKRKRFIEYKDSLTRRLKSRSITGIKFDRVDDCQCIYVESESHTYITDNVTVTHNTTIARAFANLINKGKGSPIEIDAASHNSVDDVRSLIENAKLRSIDSEYKVIVCDEAHAITSQGWQAFLKTIEEPPEKTIFMFCTTNPEKIPLTIQNRVMRFNLTKIPTKEIRERLEYICQQENIIDRDNCCDYIAKLANGGMRDAIAYLEKVADYSKELTIENTLNILGSYSYDDFLELTNAIIDGNQAKVLNIIEVLDNNGKNLKNFVDEYMKFILDLNKYSLFKDISMTTFPISLEDKVKYAVSFDKDIDAFNLIIDSLLELKQTIRYDDTYVLTIKGYFVKILERIKELWKTL